MPPLRTAALLTLVRCAASLTAVAPGLRVHHHHHHHHHHHLLSPTVQSRRSPLGSIRNCASAEGAVADESDAAAPAGGDVLVSAISGDGSISAKAVVTTDLIAETARLQGLGGLASAALGRALTCTILVAEGLKEDETFQVNFRGDGPLRGVLAIANGDLEARGYVGNPSVTLPPNAMGKFDVGAGVGKGSLQVVRTKHLPGEEVSSPYTSFTEIKTGEVPEDINWYLLDSEQKEGALAAGVYVQGTDDGVDRNGAQLGAAGVQAAGGWYVQLLPFADEDAVAKLQENLAALANRSPTTMVREGLDAEAVVRLLLDGLDPQIMTRRAVPSLAATCQCSDERVMRTLRLLPRSEVDDIMEKNENIEVKCEFCGKLYNLTPAEIQAQL